jgi:membrane protease YdiL (CAAX protease family)
MAFSALLLKILYIKEVNYRIFEPDTLLVSAVIISVFSVIGSLFIYTVRIKNRVFRPGFFLKLLILYIPFALLQQIFFQYLFLNDISTLIAGKIQILLFGVLFFGLAHSPKETVKLTVFSLIAGSVWIWTYMSYGNIFWPVLSHAFLGSLYYCLVHPSNRLTARLKFLGNNQ